MAYASGHTIYRKYLDENEGVLTKLNLLEIYYRALEEHDQKVAKDILASFYKYTIDFDAVDISDAIALRSELKKEKKLDISYADALGYCLSRKMGIKFLTGDSAFEKLKGVEFVR